MQRTFPSSSCFRMHSLPITKKRNIDSSSLPKFIASLDNTLWGYGTKELQAIPCLQENYEHRNRTRTSEYVEFYPVPR